LKTQKNIAAKYRISDTTICNWKRKKEEIFKMADSNCRSAKSKIAKGKHPELEDTILELIRLLRDLRIPTNADLIKEKAKEVASSLSFKDFKASDRWYAGFKNRRDLVVKKTVGSEDRIDHKTTDEWRENELPKILAKYSPEQIYNADETGLFFELLPDRTLTTKDDRCKFFNDSKNRITVLFAENFTRYDKLPPLVIGKSKKPRCFRNVKSLPVIYESNRSAWMDSKIFNSWLQKVDSQMIRRKREIVLLLDNVTCHSLNPTLILKNVNVQYLSPNSTSILQPLDQ